MWLRAKIEIARLVGSGFDHNIPPYLPNIPQELSREEDGGRADHLRKLSRNVVPDATSFHGASGLKLDSEIRRSEIPSFYGQRFKHFWSHASRENCFHR